MKIIYKPSNLRKEFSLISSISVCLKVNEFQSKRKKRHWKFSFIYKSQCINNEFD